MDSPYSYSIMNEIYLTDTHLNTDYSRIILATETITIPNRAHTSESILDRLDGKSEGTRF